MRYLLGLFAAFTAFLTVYNVIKPDVYFRIMLLAFVLVLLQLILISCLAKRWQGAGAYLMPIVFIYCFGGQAFWAFYEDTEFKPEDWTFAEYKVYVVQEAQLYMNYVLYILLFSPSVPFTCFVYVPIFIVGKLVLDIQILGTEATETLVFMVILSFCMILAPSVVFYIVQTHEITRFYQH